MHFQGSVCPSVCPFVCALTVEPFDLCVCNQWAYADNRADAVDRLLIGHNVSPLNNIVRYSAYLWAKLCAGPVSLAICLTLTPSKGLFDCTIGS